jgi:hypothetical protein
MELYLFCPYTPSRRGQGNLYCTLIIFFFSGEGSRSRRYGRTAAMRLIVQPYDEDEDDYFCPFPSNGMKLTGENLRTRGKTCPSSNLSTTNPTWTDPGSNPGLRSGRPAANRVSHGTACTLIYFNKIALNNTEAVGQSGEYRWLKRGWLHTMMDGNCGEGTDLNSLGHNLAAKYSSENYNITKLCS